MVLQKVHIILWKRLHRNPSCRGILHHPLYLCLDSVLSRRICPGCSNHLRTTLDVQVLFQYLLRKSFHNRRQRCIGAHNINSAPIDHWCFGSIMHTLVTKNIPAHRATISWSALMNLVNGPYSLQSSAPEIQHGSVHLLSTLPPQLAHVPLPSPSGSSRSSTADSLHRSPCAPASSSTDH